MFAATALKTETTNGAVAYTSTASHNLDFFVRLGDIKYKEQSVIDFVKAYEEDKDLAIRNLLHSRDIRHGKGVRNAFNLCMLHLAKMDVDIFLKTNLLTKITQLGYYPDLFGLVEDNDVDVRIKKKIIRLLAEHLKDEDTSDLVAKWLPLKGAVASMLRSYLKVSPKELRQLVVPLRSNVTERYLCEKRIEEIVYKHVPSKAMNRYKNTFAAKDQDRFATYIQSVMSGETTLNSKALFIHEISKEYYKEYKAQPGKDLNLITEAQWKSFPNLIKEGLSILPVVDLSGSMDANAGDGVTYKHIAITLGAYMSERIEGPFKNLVTTFADQPAYVDLKDCTSLHSRYNSILAGQVGYSTNVEGVFKLLLNTVLDNNLTSEHLPEYLIFLSDTQFNFNQYESTAYIAAQAEFKRVGLKCPKLIFWVLNTTRIDNFPVKYDESGACLVSGFSPSLLQAVCSDQLSEFSPEAVMRQTLLKYRYTLYEE